MGTVYLAEMVELGDPVAVKVIAAGNILVTERDGEERGPFGQPES